MAEPHIDTPGEIRWFASQAPMPVVGPCPHTGCAHYMQRVVAWGPDFTRYELVTCQVPDGCAGQCRAWTDGSIDTTTSWLQVSDRG